MKKASCTLFLLLFLLQNLFGQIPPACAIPNPPLAKTCAQSCVLCDLDGYTGTTTQTTQGQILPGFCTQVVHSMGYLGFVAGSTNLTIDVAVGACTLGNSIEMGIYQTDDCQNFNLVSDCNTAMFTANTYSFTNTEPLVPGCVYFLVFDNNGPASCAFTVTVLSGSATAPPVAQPAVPSGPKKVCPGATAVYTVPPIDGACVYRWTAPAGTTINGQPSPVNLPASEGTSVTVTWGNQGGQLCVRGQNPCSQGNNACLPVIVAPIPPTVLPQLAICNGTSIEWIDGNLYGASQMLSTTYTTDLGCDSVVNQQLIVRPPILTNLGTLRVCQGECVTVGNTQYCTPGFYQEKLLSVDDCDSTVLFNLIVVLADANIALPDTLTCLLDTIVLDGSASTAGSVFTWINPAGFPISNQPMVAVSTPGTYKLAIQRTSSGLVCRDTALAVVPANQQLPHLNAAGDTITCLHPLGLLDGSSSTTGATFQWAGPNGFTASVPDTVVATPGTYVLTVTAPNGCFRRDTALVETDLTPPVLSTGLPDTLTCTRDSVLLKANATPPGVTLLWNGPQNFTSTLLNPPVAVPGTYQLTATNLNGCTTTATEVVAIDTIAPALTASGGTRTCAQPAVPLSLVFSPANAALQWSGPGNFSSTLPNPVVSQAGLYSVVATAPNGCTAATAATVLADTLAPQVSAVGALLNCAQTSAALSASVTPAGAALQWSGPQNFSSGLLNPTVNSPGVYVLNVSASNGCTASASATVSIDTVAPQISALGGTLTCLQNSIALSAMISPAGSSVQWTGPQNFSSAQTNPVVNLAGMYTATATAANGCTASATATVQADATIPQVSASGGVITCAQSAVVLSATVSPAGSSLSWTGPQNFSSNQLAPVVSAPGTYVLTVSTPNGCSASASATVASDVAPPTLSATGSGTITCAAPSVLLTAVVTPSSAALQWTGPQNFNSTSANPAVGVPGTYTVGAVAPNGCSAQATVVVPIDTAAPKLQLTGGTLTCAKKSFQLAASVTPAGSALQWTGPQNFSATQANPTVTIPGSYTLAATAANGCSSEASVQVLIDTVAPVLSVSSDVITCFSTTAVLHSTLFPAAASILWNGPQNFSSSQNNPVVNNGGNYVATATTPNGCTAQAATTVQVDTVAPSVSASGGVLTCLQSSLALAAAVSPANCTLQWAGPQNFTSTLLSPTVQTAGDYVLLATAANGCTATATVQVSADNSFPQVSAAGGTLTCSQTNLLLSASVAPAGSGVQWTGPQNFSSNQTTPSVNLPGLYTLTATTSSGCTATATATVGIDTLAPQASAAGGLLTCAVTQTALSLTFAPPNCQVSWSGPQNFQSTQVNPLASTAGVYTVLLTGPNGCTATATATVSADVQSPSVSASGGVLTCAVPALNLQSGVQPAGSVLLWSGPQNFSSTQAAPSVSAAGNYTLLATAPNGCTATATATVSADVAPPQVSATGGIITCLNPVTALSSSVSPSGSTLQWIGPQGFGSASPNPPVQTAGTYTLTASAPNGCTATATATVSADVQPPDVSAAGGAITCLEDSVILTVEFSPAGGSVVWTGPPPFQATGSLTPATSQPGTYTVTATAPNGCTATATAEVEAHDQPAWTLSLAPIELAEEYEVVLPEILTDLPKNERAALLWTFPEQVWEENPCTDCEHPILKLTADANITVSLTDLFGCVQTAVLHIPVQQTSLIYVPNIFAPEAQTENQFFQVFVGAAARVVEFPVLRVFDRWGTLVHERLRFLPDDPNHGWDGSFRGQAAAPGVYVWYLEVVFENGRRKLLKGDVTLVR